MLHARILTGAGATGAHSACLPPAVPILRAGARRVITGRTYYRAAGALGDVSLHRRRMSSNTGLVGSRDFLSRSFATRAPPPRPVTTFHSDDYAALLSTVLPKSSSSCPSSSSSPNTPPLQLSPEQVSSSNAAVHAFRRALVTSHLGELHEALATLQSLAQDHRLGSSDVAAASHLVSVRMGKEDMGMLEDVAVWAAAVYAQPSGLKDLMIGFLKKDDPEKVKAVYRRYRTALEQRTPSSSTPSSPEPASHPFSSQPDIDAPAPSPPTGSSRASSQPILLPPLIAAHALTHTFNAARAAVLGANCSPRTARASGVFREGLEHRPNAMAQAQAYYARLQWAPELAWRSRFLWTVRRAVRDKRPAVVGDMYRAALAASEGEDAWVPTTVGKGDETTFALDDRAWGEFITAASNLVAAARESKSSADVLDPARVVRDLTARGVQRGSGIYSALLSDIIRRRDFADTDALLAEMARAGVQPDAEISAGVIATLFNARESERALAVFNAVQGRHGAPTEVCNAMLSGLVRDRQLEAAQSLLAQMPSPNLVTFNILLRDAAHRGDMESLLGTLRTIQARGLKADAVTFTTLLDALNRAGKPDAVRRVLATMRSLGVEPDMHVYSSMIDLLAKSGGTAHLRDAVRMLDEMERSGFRTTEITYTGLMTGFLRSSDLPDGQGLAVARQLMDRMRARGIRASATTYNFLIRASLVSLRSADADTPFVLLEQMDKERIAPNKDTWYTLLRGLVDRFDQEGVARALREMEKRGWVPTEDALTRFVHKIRSGAVFAQVSASSGIQPTPELLSAFSSASADTAPRFLLASISNEALVPSGSAAARGSAKDDFALLAEHVKDAEPSYVLYRLDSKAAGTGAWEWVLVAYVPDEAKVRDKMLYASSRAALTKGLGENRFVDSIFATSKSDLTPVSYAAHLVHRSAAAPLTAKEAELASVRAAEKSSVDSMVGTTVRRAHAAGGGVALAWGKGVREALEGLAQGQEEGAVVQLAVDVKAEQIVLDRTATFPLSQLASEIPTSEPRFTFYRFDESTVVFIYTCPSTSPIKQRMLYSSSASSLPAAVSSEAGLKISKKLETNDPADLTEEYVRAEVAPAPAPTAAGNGAGGAQRFARPKAPGRRR